MLKNIFLELEYLGSNYFGFQIQNKKGKKEPTVQEKLEQALERLFGKKVKIDYTSRTDRGVHAYSQGVNFKIDTDIPKENIRKALNAFLPLDIRIKRIRFVPLDFSSRFSAISKIYRYVILNRREPCVFLNDRAYHLASRLDIERIKKVAKKLELKRDFSLFAKKESSYKSTVRKIKSILVRKRNGFIYIDVEADGFLRNMARNIVSFLIRVGEKRLSLREVEAILKKKLPYSNKPAPARGLYLYKVRYNWRAAKVYGSIR